MGRGGGNGKAFGQGRQFGLSQLAALILLTFATGPLRAEEPPVVVPWTVAPPMMGQAADGEPTGFSVDLARLLARELGIEISFRHYDTIPDLVAAQARGDTQILAGVSDVRTLEVGNLASDPVSDVQIRLGVPVEHAARIDPENLAGVRVAMIPETLGSDPDLFPGAEMVGYPTPESALIAVLSGEADAISYPINVLFAMMRAARLDGRISFVGAPLVDSTRIVAIHPSRADLLEPVNAALARLETSGELAALRAKYLIAIPAPVPEVLTVGIHQVPPFVEVDEEGNPTGFGVEVLQDLADLAGIALEFKVISDAEFGQGPREGLVDLVPMMAWNEDRAGRMDFTFSTHRVPFSIFTLKDSPHSPVTLEDLKGLRVAVEQGKNTEQLARDHGGLDLVPVEGKDGTMNALLDGRADATLSPTNAFWTHVAQSGQSELFKGSAQPFYVSQSGPALRLGLGEIRERLNVVIPGYLISDTYAERQAKWFGTPVFWTPERLRLMVAAVSGLVLVALGFGIWQKIQRSRDKEREARLLQHSRQLEVLVEELERSNRELDSFADIASHDLKEPLRAINWQVRSLEEGGSRLPEEVVRIGDLCRQMEGTISDLLASSQHRGKGFDRANIDMEALLEEIRADLRELKQATGGRLLIETPLPEVHASRAKAKVVFQNLIANGFIYNDSARPVVRVGYLTPESGDASGLAYVFYVRDNGIGIPPEDLHRIFQPGMRGTAPRERPLPGAMGSGLGLSFAKEIVESYGQLITLDSTPGKGTTFYFSLPNAKADSPDDAADPAMMDAQ